MSFLDRNILDSVAKYYSSTLATYGPSPKGVDWSDAFGQEMRLRTLLQVVQHSEFGQGLLDYGCGYGHAAKIICEEFPWLEYTGYDIVPEMISAATTHNRALPNAVFLRELSPGARWDFVISSGVFNVRNGFDDEVWLTYVQNQIGFLSNLATSGLALNFLSNSIDLERKRAELFYVDPGWLLDLLCGLGFEAVELHSDYRPWEITALAWRSKKSGPEVD